ncbi:MAG: thiamine-monophosphate kinase [Gemmatimonadales bacterium]
MTTLPREVAMIDRLAAAFARSPRQLNGRHESDAELVRLGDSDTVLALTTDAIAEEIERGLYADPWLIGWMTVTVCASDLAAVGAAPLGILINETLPDDLAAETGTQLQRGIGDACDASGLYVLGGDTNAGPHLHMSATAAGLVAGGAPLTRLGARPGERLFASGLLGLGAAYALLRLRGMAAPRYQPVARMREGQLLRGLASCAMDTSDGALVTLDELGRLNGVGFVIEHDVAEVLHPAARALAQTGLPAWTLLAGPHGEFELLFTVPDARAAELASLAGRIGWAPVELGRVTSEPGVVLSDGTSLATGRIRDLFVEVGGDVERYVRELTRLPA